MGPAGTMRRGGSYAAPVGISPYAGLRARVGHDLLLLPSVSVLCEDDAGRLLLVRPRDCGQWATIGGLVEPDEEPRAAAVREAKEEAGVDVELLGLVDVLGGPGFRVEHRNGDVAADVTAVFAAGIVGGDPAPDLDETVEVGWFDDEALRRADLGRFARAQLTAVGRLGLQP